MKVYVAGRTNNLDQIRRVQGIVRGTGHEITHDWTAIVQEVGGDAEEQGVGYARQRELAEWDREGVRQADLLVVVCSPDLCGTLIEFGIATERDTPVWILGKPERDSVFHKMAHVRRIASTRELECKLVIAKRRQDPLREVLLG